MEAEARFITHSLKRAQPVDYSALLWRVEIEMLSRIDPPQCGCADCLAGYSKPIDECTQYHLMRCLLGDADNASGCEINIKVEWRVEP